MKVLLVGHFNDQRSEGVRVVARELARALRTRGVEVCELDVRAATVARLRSNRDVDVFHFVLSPTFTGLALAKAAAVVSGRPVVVSAIHPAFPGRHVLRTLRPTLMLVQSQLAEQASTRAGVPVAYVANGVDTERFRPPTGAERAAARARFECGDSFTILHLASMTRARNVMALTPLAREHGAKVLVLGRPDEPGDAQLVQELRSEGVHVVMEKLSRVEEIYWAADLYAFPTVEPRACIETPLSVLEAMATGLPVVSTPYGALPRSFDPRPSGLVFESKVENFPARIAEVRAQRALVQTREAVARLTWDHVAAELLKHYERVVGPTA